MCKLLEKSSFLLILLLIIGYSQIVAGEIDLRRPPTSADISRIQEKGWDASIEMLQQELKVNYRPTTKARSGNMKEAVFSEWVDLLQMVSLLGKSEKESMGEFLSQYCFEDAGGQRGFISIGAEMPEESRHLLPEEAAEAAKAGNVVEELLGEYTYKDQYLADRAGNELALVLLSNKGIREEFLTTVSENDCIPQVLEALKSIQYAYPEEFKRYFSLALALAVVYDVRIPRGWPHHQVESDDVPREDPSIVERFAFWVDVQKKNRLWNDLSKLDVSSLKFVVDAPISFSELEWAQKNVRQPKASFGRVFSSIPYQHKRIDSKEFVWASGKYLLDSIAREGGICVDQAYFAMISGKARGIPTLFFTGQGVDGGHAWFGFLKSPGQWELDCGRYENQSYATGEALDPQSWKPITDHDLKRFAQNQRRMIDALPVAKREVAWAKMLRKQGDQETAIAALDGALLLAPDYWPAWEERSNFLKDASLEEQKAFWESALKQFQGDKDLAVRGKQELTRVAREMGDEKGASTYESTLIQQNKRFRSDLSIDIVAKKMQSALSDNTDQGFQEALQIYKESLTTLGKTGGGELFYSVVQPFVEVCLDRGKIIEAKQALAIARRIQQPSNQSILDQEMKALDEKIKTSSRSN